MARCEVRVPGRGWALAGVCVVLIAILWPPALSAQELDLDSRVGVQFGRIRYHRAEQVFVTSGTLTNISSDVLLEPLSLVLTSVNPGVILANSSGQTGDGLPFVSVPLPDGFLGPGGRVTELVLRFKNPLGTDIRFTTSLRGGLSVVEPLLQTQGELVGVAVASDGTAYVSDVRHGEILRLDPTGAATIIAAGLRRPSGLALDGVDLLIAEEGAGRVLRLTPARALTVLGKGLRTPRSLAVGHDGSIYITAHRLLGPDGSDPGEAEVIIRRDPSTGRLDVVATGVHQLEALALNGTALFAAAGWVGGLPQAQGVIASYPLRPDGRLGPPTYFVPGGLPDPRGLVLDQLASLYVTSRSRAIVKVHADAHLTPFAPSLADPRGLALGPDGSLYVADGRSGRLLRFTAPPAPSLAGLPAFTRESPLTVSGTAVPIARADLFVNDATTAITGSSDNRGAFSLAAPLALNAKNTLEVFATARLGNGLTSAPAQAIIHHDNQPPTISFVVGGEQTAVGRVIVKEGVSSASSSAVRTASLPTVTEVILDNAAVGVAEGTRSFTGTWCVSGATGSFGADSLYSCGAGADTYRWTPTLAAAQYDVYVWWTEHVNRSTAVPISVTHAGGTTTKTFNEQTGGGQWVLHGRYSFNAGTGGFVQVSNASGQAAADAVRFTPVSLPTVTEVILDNAAVGVADGTRSFTGTWCVSGAAGFFGADSLYSCGAGTDTYRWTPTLAAAQYDVYVWWTQHVNRSTAVPISVTHAGGTTTKTFNEQTGGGQWVLHGRYSFNAGTGGFVQVSNASGQAAADAVRFTPAAADVTPPDTSITGGPTGTMTVGSATFTWTGSDAVTPTGSLQYASRLDPLEPSFSAFGAATTKSYTGLANGAYTFSVKARDAAGNEDLTLASRSFTVGTLSIQVTSPPAGATVQAGPLLVRGSVSAGGADVGVTVNGRPAAVHGSAFAALVSVDPSTTQLVAVATTVTGATASSAIPIRGTGNPSDAVVLRPSPESGIAPLQVTFSVSAPRPVTQLALDVDGNGSVDFQGPSLDGQSFTYALPGLYVASVTVTDSQGAQTNAAAIIQVFDRAQLDALLQGRWNALRDALSRADVPGAVSLFTQASRDAYQDQLGALAGVGALGQVASDLGPIRLVHARTSAAEYELRAIRNGVEYSFYVPFVVDSDGVWRLRAF